MKKKDRPQLRPRDARRLAELRREFVAGREPGNEAPPAVRNPWAIAVLAIETTVDYLRALEEQENKDSRC
ncbi:MAG: hypothetical protein ACLQIQ_08525 [Beijerinckiaceae bacterium]